MSLITKGLGGNLISLGLGSIVSSTVGAIRRLFLPPSLYRQRPPLELTIHPTLIPVGVLAKSYQIYASRPIDLQVGSLAKATPSSIYNVGSTLTTLAFQSANSLGSYLAVGKEVIQIEHFVTAKTNMVLPFYLSNIDYRLVGMSHEALAMSLRPDNLITDSFVWATVQVISEAEDLRMLGLSFGEIEEDMLVA